ncbi:MAG TPA: hypothetical protein P5121_14755 [Caldilineaceae bacterium]|nr:hypothetical protein [Caldilineaceae bacterium]
MLRSYGRGIVILIVAMALVMVWTGSALAQAPTGTGPDEAMTPTGQWVKIESGEYHWYVFHFDYDEDRVEKPVEIRMYTEPYDVATLTVRNEEQAQLWRDEGEQEHFGCCTMVDEDKDENGKPDYAVWAGSLRSSGTYYIVVEHSRDNPASGMYRFTISGEGLSFPKAMPAPMAEKAEAAPAAAAPEPRMVAEEGGGPDLAMIPTGEWTTIEEGQYHWYTFYFDFDEDYETEPIEIRMYTDVYDGATLTVRNEEQAQLWRDEGEQEHFGCCTMVDIDKDEDGKADYAMWAGTLRSSGQYYIVVEHAKSVAGPVAYRFTMTGRGFSFPTATPTAEQAVEAPTAPMAPAAEVAPSPIMLSGLNGTGPDYALAPTGEETLINEGEFHWYAFEFAYDDEEVMAPVEIRFYGHPSEGATLTVRNTEQAEQWRKEGEHLHFGCCTLVDKDEDDDGVADYAVWAGNLRESGTYYIVVEHARNMSGPVSYHFVITGDGVSW